jgi:integrase
VATQDIPKRFSFTRQAIETLPSTDQQQDFRDTKTPHLTVRVAKRKVFYWYGKVRGRAQRIKLGIFPDLSVENARKFAQRISANVAEGKPPIEEHREETTLGQLFQTYLDVWAKSRKKSWRQDEYSYNRHLKHWQHRKLADITKTDLQRLHATIGTEHGTTTANRVRSLLSAMWNVARDNGQWDGDNPVSAVKKFAEQERERYLRGDELPGFFSQLDADENQDYADYVRLSLFTGGRQANVLAMRWDQLHFERAEWTIPAAQFKSGQVQTIPLSAEALQVLQKRKENTVSDWVFPGRGVTKHLTRPGKWWESLLLRCKLSDNLTMHDLRRTLGSWQAAGGASLLIIGKTLGHKDSRSTQVYARLDLDPVRESVSAAGKAIAAAGRHEQKPDTMIDPGSAENRAEFVANASDEEFEQFARTWEEPHTSMDDILSNALILENKVEQLVKSLPTALGCTYYSWWMDAETLPAKVHSIQSTKDLEKLAIKMYELGHMIGKLEGEMSEVTEGRQKRQQCKRHLNQILETERTKKQVESLQKERGCSRTAARELAAETAAVGYRQIMRRDREEKLPPKTIELMEQTFGSNDSRPSLRFLVAMMAKYIGENW